MMNFYQSTLAFAGVIQSFLRLLFYWFLFLVPVCMQLARWRRVSNSPGWLFGFFLITVIGLRFQVGGDWYTYLDGLEIFNNVPLEEVLFLKYEVGFNLLNWFSKALDVNIYGVNLVCATIFVVGLTKLSRDQPYPWLAVTVAVPYLVIVVAMGYTRQATAIGLLMFGFGYLLQGRVIQYLAMVVLAASFHQTAIVFSTIPLLQPGRGYFRLALGLVLLATLGSISIILEQASTLYLHYVEENMESSGGIVRVLMNLPPVLIMLAYWRKWGEKYGDRWLWWGMALAAIACVPLVLIASTAVDRMALYLIPMQIVSWSRLPMLIQGRIQKNLAIIAVIIYSATVQFIWLVYGNFSSSWIPYDNLIFPDF